MSDEPVETGPTRHASARRLRTDAWFALRHELGNHRVTLPVLGVLPGEKVMVGPRSDACIGGFIRSGNTFGFYAFKRSNPSVAVAHHVHASQQVRKAVALKVPCVLLVREPLEAVTSLLVFEHGRLSAKLGLWGYVRFHERIIALRENIAICSFSALKENPSCLALSLNEKFGTEFAPLPEGLGQSELLSDIERFHVNRGREPRTFSVPTVSKHALAEEARDAVRAHQQLQVARSIYERLVN